MFLVAIRLVYIMPIVNLKSPRPKNTKVAVILTLLNIRCHWRPARCYPPRPATAGAGIPAIRVLCAKKALILGMSALLQQSRSCGTGARTPAFATTTLRHGLRTAMASREARNIRARGDHEHHVPVSGRLLRTRSRPYQQGCGALGGIKHRHWWSRISSRRCRCRSMGTAIDLTPRRRTPTPRGSRIRTGSWPSIKRPDADAFDAERDEHRVLAADHVGDPAEERPGQSVEDAVDGRSERHRRSWSSPSG